MKGYFLILTGASCWGLIGIFSLLAFSQGVHPMEVAFWRATVAGICFGAQAIIMRQTRIDRKDFGLMVVFGLIGVSLFYVSYQFAVKTGGAAFASVLLYTAPAWVMITAFVVFKEKISPLKIMAVILVIVGVFLISRAGSGSGGRGSFSLVAVGTGLLSGFCYSLYYTIGKHFSNKYSSANLFLWVFSIGALGILPFVDFAFKTPLAWAALISVGFVSTFLGYLCYYQGLKYLEAGEASIVATIEPVVAALAAYLFFGEAYSLWGYAGAGLILAAVLLTIFEGRS